MTGAVRETVGVFTEEHALQQAVDELLILGFDRSAFSLLSSQRAVAEKLGHRYQKVDELEDNLKVPRRAFVGRDSATEGKGVLVGGLAYVGAISAMGAVVASGGTVAAAILGAAAAGGSGGAIGVLLTYFMNRRHAEIIQDQLEKGGLLLWVRTRDAGQESQAARILARCGAGHVHAHDLPPPRYATTGGLSYDMSFMKWLGL